jgi:hypothetical protein
MSSRVDAALHSVPYLALILMGLPYLFARWLGAGGVTVLGLVVGAPDSGRNGAAAAGSLRPRTRSSLTSRSARCLGPYDAPLGLGAAGAEQLDVQVVEGAAELR